jgi:hypothetical protein
VGSTGVTGLTGEAGSTGLPGATGAFGQNLRGATGSIGRMGDTTAPDGFADIYINTPQIVSPFSFPIWTDRITGGSVIFLSPFTTLTASPGLYMVTWMITFTGASALFELTLNGLSVSNQVINTIDVANTRVQCSSLIVGPGIIGLMSQGISTTVTLAYMQVQRVS